MPSRLSNRTNTVWFCSRIEKLVTPPVKPVFLDSNSGAETDGDYKEARASLHERPHADKHATTES